MNSSALDTREALAIRVEVSEDALSVELADGRTIVAPIATFSRHSGDREKRDGDLAATRSSAYEVQ